MVKALLNQKVSRIPILSTIKKNHVPKKLSYLQSRNIDIDNFKPLTRVNKLSPKRSPLIQQKRRPIIAAPFFSGRDTKPLLPNFCDIGVVPITPRKTRSGRVFSRKSLFNPMTPRPTSPNESLSSNEFSPIRSIPVNASTPVRNPTVIVPVLPSINDISVQNIDLEELNKTNEDVPNLFDVEEPAPLFNFEEDMRKSPTPEITESAENDFEDKENREYQELMNKVWSSMPQDDNSFTIPVPVFSTFKGFKPAFTDSPTRRRSSIHVVKANGKDKQNNEENSMDGIEDFKVEQPTQIVEKVACIGTDLNENVVAEVSEEFTVENKITESEKCSEVIVLVSMSDSIANVEKTIVSKADDVDMEVVMSDDIQPTSSNISAEEENGESSQNILSEPPVIPSCDINSEPNLEVPITPIRKALDAVNIDDNEDVEKVEVINNKPSELVKKGAKTKGRKKKGLAEQLQERCEERQKDKNSSLFSEHSTRKSSRLSLYQRKKENTNDIDLSTENTITNSNSGDEDKQEDNSRRKRRNSIFPKQLLKQLAMDKQGVPMSPDSSNENHETGSMDSECVNNDMTADSQDSTIVENSQETTTDTSPKNKRRKSQKFQKNGGRKNKKEQSPIPIKVEVYNQPTDVKEEPIASVPYRYESEGRIMVSMVLPKDKNGKRRKVPGIPQTIEIDPSLLVDPLPPIGKWTKDSNEENYSYKKYFRWADTKEEAALEVIKEFHNDFGLRKSTYKKKLFT